MNTIKSASDTLERKGWIIAVYFALKPLYLFNSGSMQICDFILTMYIFYIFIRYRIRLSYEISKLFRSYLMLVLYQLIVNTLWYFKTNDLQMIVNSMFYIYNSMAFIIFVIIGEHIGLKNLEKQLVKGSIWSLSIVLFGLFISRENSNIRSTSFFNNPNQLGYHAIILLTVLLVFKNQYTKKGRLFVLLGAIIAVIASLSKAAIISALIVLIIYRYWYSEKITVSKIIIDIIFAIMIIGITYFLLYSDSYLIRNNRVLLEMRVRLLNMMTENDSSLGNGRGYNRIGEMGIHFLWGTGEGAYNRFNIMTNGEIHSTFVSLLVCYGLIGLCWYFSIFSKCMGKGKRYINNFAFLSGLIFYSITHNGIRNTLLWMIMASLFVQENNRLKIAGGTSENESELEEFY